MLYQSNRKQGSSPTRQDDLSVRRDDLPPNRSDGFAAPQPPTPGTPTQNTGTGQIIFRVSTARGAIPLEGAQITVRPHLPDPGNEERGKVIAVLYSDRDGKTQPLPLPTPPRSDSLQPSENGVLPFATYDAAVYLSNYYAPEYTRIPIFDGITSIQTVDLIPLPENGREEGLNPSDTMFFEGENPDL